MALCEVKAGNAIFSEMYNWSGSVNVVYKYIHKKDSAVFHHIVHRLNI